MTSLESRCETCKKCLICFAPCFGASCEYEPCEAVAPDYDKLETTGKDGLHELPRVPFDVLDI